MKETFLLNFPTVFFLIHEEEKYKLTKIEKSSKPSKLPKDLLTFMLNGDDFPSSSSIMLFTSFFLLYSNLLYNLNYINR